MNNSVIKCPHCGSQARVDQGGTVTLAFCPTIYDDNGNIISSDGNISTHSWRCSSCGTEYETKTQYGKICEVRITKAVEPFLFVGEGGLNSKDHLNNIVALAEDSTIFNMNSINVVIEESLSESTMFQDAIKAIRTDLSELEGIRARARKEIAILRNPNCYYTTKLKTFTVEAIIEILGGE